MFDEDGNRVLDKSVSFVGVAPMDDPQYIELVALDTPSRQTGLYISGGVMAAPTVGAVMADILPYLGVEKNDASGQTVTLENMEGLSRKDAQKRLEQLGLTGKCLGDAETVTDQIPAAGMEAPIGSEVLLYFGEVPQTVAVPDFMGLTRQQASDLAGSLGLSVQITGNTDLSPTVIVTDQYYAKDTQVPVGTAIRLVFTDTQTRD